MENSIILDQISRDELKQLITDVFQTVVIPTTPPENKFITREETAKKLKLSLPTLNAYTKKGIIPAYRIGSRVRYKSNDVENALKEIPNFKFRRVQP